MTHSTTNDSLECYLGEYIKWYRNLESNRETIELENERLTGLAALLESTLPTGTKVYIWLLDPERRRALVQRGGKSLRVPQLKIGATNETLSEEICSAFDLYWYPCYLGACFPLDNGYCGETLRGYTTDRSRLRQHFSLRDQPPASEEWEGSKAYKRLEDEFIKESLERAPSENHSSQAEKQPEEWTVAIIVRCWGQVRAFWGYITPNGTPPSQVINAGPVLEKFFLDGFATHCTAIGPEALKSQDGRYEHLLKACARLWKPQRLLALDRNYHVLSLAIYPPAYQESFDDPLRFTLTLPSGEPYVFCDSDVVFSVDSTPPPGYEQNTFGPTLTQEESKDFFEALKGLFPGFHFLVWNLSDPDLMDFSQIPNIIAESSSRSYSIARAIVAGINAIYDRKRSLDVERVKGEEQKAKEIVPDWAHAFQSYLMMIKLHVDRSQDALKGKLSQEISAAADATEALIRWPRMQKWREMNPTTHLSTLHSRLPTSDKRESSIRHFSASINFVKMALLHLMAKIASRDAKYVTAMRLRWLRDGRGNIEPFCVALENYVITERPRVGSAVAQLSAYGININIPEESISSMQNDKWPYELPVDIEANSVDGPFGCLLQFLIDELLFNAFKHAAVINGKIACSISYASCGDFGTLVLSNTCADAEQVAATLNDTRHIGGGRGLGILKDITYILCGPDVGQLHYSSNPSEGFLSAVIRIPLMNDSGE